MGIQTLTADHPLIPAGAKELIGKMPFNDRYQLIGFRYQRTGKYLKKEDQPEVALVPIWKDHKICRNQIRSKY